MKYWTYNEINELRNKYFYYINHHEEAEEHFKIKWEYIKGKAFRLHITSKEINKECSKFLGEHIAERVLSHVFKDVKRMNVNNIGYDFICNKGFKVDVKSSCLLNRNNYRSCYVFNLKCNKITDYFLLIGFDNRKDLNPQHIWLIKGNLVNEVKCLTIMNNKYSLSQYSNYELTDKLKDTIKCCNILKN